PVLAALQIDVAAVDFQTGVCIAWRTTIELPEAMLVETKMRRQLQVAAELPFAGDARGVASLPEHLRERRLCWVEMTELRIVAEIVLPGHELHASGRAERLYMAAQSARSALSQ